MNSDKKILVISGSERLELVRGMVEKHGVTTVCYNDPRKALEECPLHDIDGVVLDVDTDFLRDKSRCGNIFNVLKDAGKRFMVIAPEASFDDMYEASLCGAVDFVSRKYNHREFIIRAGALIYRKKRIVCIGGGTGLFNLIRGVKDIPNILLTSIVSMTDDGGSSGRLKESFGILPPGDIRRSLVALSDAPEIMNRMMQYRFDKDTEMSEHNLGNLFVTALTDITGNFTEAVRAISEILNIRGIVLPITTDQANLCAEFENSDVVKGESKIDLSEDRTPDLHIRRIWHEPETVCTDDTYASIINADLIIISSGDLYTSVATNLMVKNVPEAIIKSKAKKVYICNLMTKPGETSGYSAFDHVREVVKYLGKDVLDYIVLSNTVLSSEAIEKYAKKQQTPVELEGIEDIKKVSDAQIIVADVGHAEDLVRHDSAKIRKVIEGIL